MINLDSYNSSFKTTKTENVKVPSYEIKSPSISYSFPQSSHSFLNFQVTSTNLTPLPANLFSTGNLYQNEPNDLHQP